jgi:hypothetical protein
MSAHQARSAQRRLLPQNGDYLMVFGRNSELSFNGLHKHDNSWLGRPDEPAGARLLTGRSSIPTKSNLPIDTIIPVEL